MGVFTLNMGVFVNMSVYICTVPKSRAAVDYTLTGIEPHGPSRGV